jgi:hypothetical protein
MSAALCVNLRRMQAFIQLLAHAEHLSTFLVRMPEPHKSFETLRALATSKDRDAGLSEAPHTYCGAVSEIKCHDATCLRHQWRMHSPPCLRAAFEGPSLLSQ